MNNPLLNPNKRTKKQRPRLGCVQANTQQRYHNLCLDNLPARYRNADLMISEIHGDSLAKSGIPYGHFVVIAKGEVVKSGDLVCFTVSGEFFVRYVFFGPGGWARFQTADRENYGDMLKTPDEFEIVGLVIHAEAYAPQLSMSDSKQ